MDAHFLFRVIYYSFKQKFLTNTLKQRLSFKCIHP